jgi:NADH:ubiquinone oxidoreductase subunit 2 (subunit N)
MTEYFYKIFKATYFYLNLNQILDLFKVFIFIEFLISILLILILILTLLKKNYISIYCLTAFNIILLLLFLTYLFQSFLLNNCWFIGSFLVTNDTERALYTYDVVLTSINLELFKRSSRPNFLYLYNLPFYNNSFNFNIFIYYLKNFTLFVFLISLYIGYLQIKTLKVSFNKLLLILFPILFSNLILISTQDLIIAYLAIELQNLCLIFLISLKKKFNFNIQLSIRFFMLNSVGSLLILFGIVLLYSIFLTTNFSDIYILLTTSPLYLSEIYLFEVLFGLSILLLGLFFKLAVGPFGLWLVEIYEYSLTYGVLIFSLLPKIGYFIFLFHLYLSTSTLLFFWDFVFKLFGVLSIIIGTFGALSQIYVKRLLAFSSLNYFGYILLSFIGFTEKSTIICIMYFFVYVFISFYIWFIIMYLEKVLGRNVVLVDLVILRDHYPMLATLLSLSFFFLAGLPPFYLFILKFSTFYIFISSFTHYIIILLFLICSFISIYYYLKLIKIIHFNPSSSENYKIYPINSVSIFAIISYSFFILSPYFFLIGKFLYTVFNKLFKNYLYNILVYTKYTDKHLIMNLVNNSTLILKHKQLGKKYDLIFKNFKYTFKLLPTRNVLGLNRKILNFSQNISLDLHSRYLRKKYTYIKLGTVSWKFSQYLKKNYNFYLNTIYSNHLFEKTILKKVYNKGIFPSVKILSRTFLSKILKQLYPFYKGAKTTKYDRYASKYFNRRYFDKLYKFYLKTKYALKVSPNFRKYYKRKPIYKSFYLPFDNSMKSGNKKILMYIKSVAIKASKSSHKS